MDAELKVSAVEGSDDLAAVTGTILAQLPSWFGIPEANAEYVRAARRLPGVLALANGEPVGVLLCRKHFQEAAEIHLMAVSPAHHRRGIGTAMVQQLVSDLLKAGYQLLQVKTLGPSRADEGYAATREFYRAMGFLPLEELTTFWGSDPCLIMVRALATGSP
jgi:ribosomal protein S18 acetylase RimI-like enzyme